MKLFIFALCLIICSVNCSDLKLEQLCKEDVFDYSNVEVNSFFRVKINYTLPLLKYMLVRDDIYFRDWSKNQTEVEILYAKKDEYNKIVKNFYTNEMFNNLNASEIFKLKSNVIEIRKYFSSWIRRIGFGQQHALLEFQGVSFYGNYLLSKMYTIKMDQLNEFYFAEKDIITAVMNAQNELNKQNIGKLTFDDAKFYRYYAERIIKFDPVKISSPDVIEIGKTVETLSLTLFLPVNKFNYNPKNLPCTFALGLSTFFKENSRSFN